MGFHVETTKADLAYHMKLNEAEKYDDLEGGDIVAFYEDEESGESSYVLLEQRDFHELRGPHAEDYHQIHELRGSRGSGEGCNPSLNRNTLPPGAT